MMRLVILMIPFFICIFLNSGSVAANQSRKEAKLDVAWPFYKIEKNNHYMYLLGTIHIGKAEMYPFPRKIEQALAKSKFLVTETSASDIMDKKELYLLKDDETLEDYLSDEAIAILKQRAKEYNLDYSLLQKYQFWFVMGLFLSTGFDDLSSEYGVDQKIAELAELYHLTPQYLETQNEQIEAMRKVYTEKDADRVSKQIPTFTESKRQLEQLYTEYIQGRQFNHNESVDEFEKKQNKILVDDRNKIWVKKFESYISSGDIYFVAVGVGHLEGENGILAYFKQNGYDVKKVFE
ncbi:MULTISPECIES: TraB/GumN family protein [Bacillaceae]|uniref:TraB/GumN family protein n=1 Tax=Bacillaceae TaxID=186817 RepID=UPI00118AD991|nr:TraB/GumN family protein [Bacillus sp. S3]QCJ41435.1 TraB/GumN family protein [Bacillus sp. S3]